MKRKYEIAVLSMGGFARTLRIFSPKKADRAIIMHDGQNVFYDSDATYKKSWRALELLKSQGIKNTAVIGIDSTATREYDYMPFPFESAEKYGMKLVGGRADQYMSYLEQIVIPYLDKRFGFKFYGMLGSSAGALATLYFAARQNPRVKAYGIFSCPLFVSPEAFKSFFATAKFDKDAYYGIYSGGSETTDGVDGELAKMQSRQFVADSYTVFDALKNGGATDIDISVVGTARHDEMAWRPPAMQLFKRFSTI